MISKYSEIIIFILLNILLISTFIVIFFFTYGTTIEKQSIKIQMEFLANNIYDDIKFSGKNTTNLIKNYLNKYSIPDLSAEDNLISSLNKQTINKATKYILIFILVILSIVGLIYYNNNNINLKNILIKNIIILLSIALTEYIFLSYITYYYISLDPNNIKLAIIQNIHQKITKLKN
jgi:hypothetical protein